MEILTAEQMSLADKLTIENLHIPSIVLMENAAIASTDIIVNLFDRSKKIAIIVGSGNNGGDGLAIGRHLFNKGYDIKIFLVESTEKFSHDAKINYDIIKKFPIKIEDYTCFNPLDFDVIIDAIFGTGLNRPLFGKYAEIVDKINGSNRTIIAVDIPSGLSGNTNNILGINIKADFTITFCRKKIPHILYPAKAYCGKIFRVDISIPNFIMSDVSPYMYELNIETLPLLKKRDPNSHKGHYGHAVIIGGSYGKSGAVILSTKAALRTGVGLITAIIPEKISSPFSSNIPEAMYLPLENDGYLSSNNFQDIATFCTDKNVIAIGPGLGKNEDIKTLLTDIINATDKIPLVIDADGINNLSEESLEKLCYRTIITPHIGEFSRLLGKPKEEILSNILQISRDFALQYGIVLVLKSSNTIIATPSGDLFLYEGGVPALAKGGSGDCLTGIITSFVAQGYSLEDAAKLGTYLLGATAKEQSKKINEHSILTTDIIEGITDTLNDITDKQYR
ncbi:MAG: NAD(P)H-hydrate dehydratase [Deferribacterales bacterium]